MKRYAELEGLLSPVIEGVGCSLEGIEYVSGSNTPILRIYIDKPGGVTTEDCGKASRKINALLAVESPIGDNYALEVSSPGLDRLLFTNEHFKAQVGKEINVKMMVPVDGRKKFKGKLLDVDDSKLSILVDNQQFELMFAEIDKARLVPTL